MKYFSLLILLCTAIFTQAQVGIGTTTPSNNAALDVTSANKGIMLPRINDTTNVASPGAGLLIYNLKTKKPTFHNGTRWNSLQSESSLAGNDSITYTITGGVTGFTNGTYKVMAVSQGMSNAGIGSQTNFQDISFTTGLDINTTGFSRLVSFNTTAASMVIEIKFYAPGSNTPYFSLKGTNLGVSSFSLGGTSGTYSDFAVQISISPVIFGYKNWINNISFAWDNVMNISVTY
ncbi:MAG: hypothetical protein V4722_00210 [Bacteroidota bacterium]